MARWVPVEERLPEDSRVVLLYRAGDLYPVIGWWNGDRNAPMYFLEEGGAEGDAGRVCPILQWAPTHWRELDCLDPLPLPGEED